MALPRHLIGLSRSQLYPALYVPRVASQHPLQFLPCQAPTEASAAVRFRALYERGTEALVEERTPGGLFLFGILCHGF